MATLYGVFTSAVNNLRPALSAASVGGLINANALVLIKKLLESHWGNIQLSSLLSKSDVDISFTSVGMVVSGVCVEAAEALSRAYDALGGVSSANGDPSQLVRKSVMQADDSVNRAVSMMNAFLFLRTTLKGATDRVYTRLHDASNALDALKKTASIAGADSILHVYQLLSAASASLSDGHAILSQSQDVLNSGLAVAALRGLARHAAEAASPTNDTPPRDANTGSSSSTTSSSGGSDESTDTGTGTALAVAAHWHCQWRLITGTHFLQLLLHSLVVHLIL
jgi:hypothetical protein